MAGSHHVASSVGFYFGVHVPVLDGYFAELLQSSGVHTGSVSVAGLLLKVLSLYIQSFEEK